MEPVDYDQALKDLVARGDAEVIGHDEAGNARYRLTPQGIENARKIYERLDVDPDAPDPEGENLGLLLDRLDAEQAARDN